MKKYILYLILMSLSHIGFAQNLTPPQVSGYLSASTINVNFPFNIKGVPFTQIPKSVWYPTSVIIADFQMNYYLEGDDSKQINTIRKHVIPNSKTGAWEITGLSIEPLPHSTPNARVDHQRTTYMLSIYQIHTGQKSAMWYANIHLNQIQTNKIPAQKLGPIKVHPKDKVILNPQPIPPKEIKRKIRTKN
ncbi:hypothetical protein [Pedobacter xixiisoli]|uniref:Uncharacterized protein n=1 Tax=Pedobacter xixiisoli TaxID=1476464 RepID=A0A285ZX60_9SPHI|nr:hypothetical protein [Pedobacter xixiisoli]SOD14239.1 hypothetical protein SAMN06297358_1474 [Pedobacter xixiisoli]